MMNLFSSFDPCIGLNYLFVFNWVISFIFFLMFPSFYWFVPSRFLMSWMLFLMMLFNEFKIIILGNFSNILMFCSLLTFILMTNFFGLFPYIFTSSSHLLMTLSLSLPIWISLMLFGWLNYTNMMFCHLVPQGTPLFLMFFMVLIETVSNIIRPWTLAIRLSANMMAGHLLLTLMGNLGSSLFSLFLILLLILQLILFLLEFSVGFIQSYVFSVLSLLYSSEINH